MNPPEITLEMENYDYKIMLKKYQIYYDATQTVKSPANRALIFLQCVKAEAYNAMVSAGAQMNPSRYMLDRDVKNLLVLSKQTLVNIVTFDESLIQYIYIKQKHGEALPIYKQDS